MRAIGYFRHSSKSDSTQDLEKAFSTYCSRNLHQPVRTFCDVDSVERDDTSYQLMLQYMQEAQSNFLIVVPDSGHLGQDLESVARTVVELEGAGAKITCDHEEYPDPLQNAFQILGVKGISRTRSKRIKESMRARALKGQGLGKAPFGYRIGADGKHQVVQQEATIVKLIYQLYTNKGLGLRLIVKHLNEKGMSTRKGGMWNMITIRDILRNPTYTGTYTRFGLRLPRSHEGIIQPEVFRAAQDNTSARRPSNRKSYTQPFLLSGLTYCAYCRNKMMGVTRRQTWKRKDGRRAAGIYRYYQCQSRNNQSICGYHTWKASALEADTLAQLKSTLEAKSHSNKTGFPPSIEKEDLWDVRIRNAERRFIKAMRRASHGDLSVKELGDYLRQQDNIRTDANNARHFIEPSIVLSNFDSLSIAQQQTFLNQQVTRIVVRDNDIDVIMS